MRRQFAKNLTSNWAVYVASALISLSLTPYIIAKLGKAAYGVWILVGSFSGYLGLFDFGIGYAVVRFVARYQQTGDVRRRNEVIATSFYSAGVLTIGVIIATLYIAHNAPIFFDIPQSLIFQSKLVILLIGLSIAIAFPMGIFSEALAGGLWRYDLFNKVSLTISIAQAILTVICLELGFGLPGLGVAVLLCSSIGYLWRMRMLYRLLPDLSIGFHLVTFAIFKKIGNYAFFSFFLVLAGRIAFYSDSFIVGVFRGVEDVAVFGVAVKLVEYLRQLIFTLTKLFTSAASKYSLENDRESLLRLFYDGSRLHLLFSLPLSVGLFFWGGPFIHLWIGDSFKYSATVLQVLLIGHILSFTQGICGEILLGIGRHRVFSILSMGAAVVNILLSIILVKKIGLIGVAWGTSIPLALLSVGYLLQATLKVLQGNILTYLRRALLPALSASLLPIIAIILTSFYLVDVWRFLGFGMSILILYMATGYLWGLNSSEKKRVQSEISRIWP